MRARKPKVIKENSERWLLTYSDLITLLLIFFILLYAISTTDQRKFADLTGALRQAFNNGQFQMVTIGGTPGNPHTFSGTTQSQKDVKAKLLTQIQHSLTILGIPQNTVTVGSSQEGLVISLAGKLLFYPGGYQLQPDSLGLMGRIASVLTHIPNQVRVEGNTDNQGVGAAGVHANWVLSSLRAVSVVEFLSTQGVAPTRLQAMGLGQYHPTSTNKTPEGRAANRHADIVILYPATTQTSTGPAASSAS